MKKVYEETELEVIVIKDVITASLGVEGKDPEAEVVNNIPPM